MLRIRDYKGIAANINNFQVLLFKRDDTIPKRLNEQLQRYNTNRIYVKNNIAY
jgi:hypothetical protein